MKAVGWENIHHRCSFIIDMESVCLCWCEFSFLRLLNLPAREIWKEVYVKISLLALRMTHTYTHLYFLEGNTGLTLRLFSFITAELLICRVTSLHLQTHLTSLLCLDLFADIQCLVKVFIPINFFTFCYVAAFCYTVLNYFFPTSIHTPYT